MELETFFSPSQQTMFFLYSVLMGVGLGIFFDLFRTVRIIIPHTTFFVVLEDIIFAFIWGTALVVFSMEICYGEIRFYYFIGNLLGFIVYILTVGKIVIGALRIIALTICKIFKFIYKILFVPIIKILVSIRHILSHGFVAIYLKIKIFVEHVKKHLQDNHNMLYNKATHKKIIKRKQKDVKKVEKNKQNKAEKKSVVRHS